MTYLPRLSYLTTAVTTPPVTTNAKSEEWDDRTGMSGTINGLDASWTTFGASQSRAYNNGKLVLTGTASGGFSPNIAGMYKAQPSTPYTVTCEVAHCRHTNYNMAHLGFCDSSGTMKLWGIEFSQEPVTNVDEYRRVYFDVGRYASVTSRTSSSTPTISAMPRVVWLQITNDGSNCIARWSPTGVAGSFEVLLSESYATALLTPTRFWVGTNPFSTSTPVVQIGPVRVT